MMDYHAGSSRTGTCVFRSRAQCPHLQDKALVLLAAAATLARQESSTGGVLEHLADTLVGLGRALEVLVGANLLADLLTLKT